MSRGTTISILGLYHYNNDLFSLMQYPDGFSDDQKETFIGNTLAECAELESLFPSWDTLHNMIGLWSKLEKPVWNRIYQASLLEYNPIENYNRTEIETIDTDKSETHSGSDVSQLSGSDALARTGTDTMAESGSDSIAKTGTDTLAKTGTEALAKTGTEGHSLSSTNTETHSGTDTNTNSMTAYDSNTLYTHDKSDLSHGQQIGTTGSGSDTITHNTTDTTTFNTSDTTTHNTTDTTTFGKTETTTHNTTDTTTFGKKDTFTHGEHIVNDDTITRENHTTGNIGVTTSQQMLQQEIDIAAALNIIPIMVQSFKERFCLLVY